MKLWPEPLRGADQLIKARPSRPRVPNSRARRSCHRSEVPRIQHSRHRHPPPSAAVLLRPTTATDASDLHRTASL